MAIDSIGKSGAPAPLPAAPPVAVLAAAATPAAVSVKPVLQPSSEQVKQAVEAMKEIVKPTAANTLQFSIDQDTGKTIVRVTDAQTGEMIRQIPSEELLEIARSLDKLQGLLLKQKA